MLLSGHGQERACSMGKGHAFEELAALAQASGVGWLPSGDWQERACSCIKQHVGFAQRALPLQLQADSATSHTFRVHR